MFFPQVFGLGIFSTAVLTLFTPLAARGGIGALVALRVLMGFAEGVTIPCMHAIWSKWSPPLERSRMVGIVVAGQYLGAVIAMSTCGILAQEYGWESLFYVFGGIGCFWYVFWAWLIRESPEKDSRISEEEKRYIMASLQHTKNAKRQHVPWVSIFSSTAVWAIVLSHFAENWGVYTMLTQLPTFLKCEKRNFHQNFKFYLQRLSDRLSFDLANSGFIAAVPYLAFGTILLFAGYLADWIQKKGFLSTGNTRKTFNTIAFATQTVFLMLAAYSNNRVMVVIFITLGAALGALSICGYGVNHLDVAPQFASILMGITNTAATVPGIVSPLIAGFIVTNQSVSWKREI